MPECVCIIHVRGIKHRSLFSSAVCCFHRHHLVWSPSGAYAGLAEDEAADTSGFILNNLFYSQDHSKLLLSYIQDVISKDSLLLLLVNTLPVHCVTISTGMEQKTPLIQTGISHTQDMIMHHRLILSPECAFKTSCGSDYKNQHMNMVLYLISRTEFNRNHPKSD